MVEVLDRHLRSMANNQITKPPLASSTSPLHSADRSFASCRQTRIFCACSRGIILSAAVSFIDDDSAKLAPAQVVPLKPSTNSETANRNIQLLPTPCRSVPQIEAHHLLLRRELAASLPSVVSGEVARIFLTSRLISRHVMSSV